MTRSKGGFTIIEVTLVMAITGVLAMLLIVGWARNLSTQSYKDGVNSLVAKLQNQYDEVYNTSNDRGKTLTCRGAPVYDATTTTTNQGSSDCVVLGRYLLFSNDTVTIKRIIGIDTNGASTTSDIDAIKDFSPQSVVNDVELADEYQLPWGITLYQPNTAKTPVNKAVVIVRSPLSGAVYTYSLDTAANTEPKVIDVLKTGTTDATVFCLQPGTAVSSTPMAVTITKDASTHESVGTKSYEGGNECAL